MMSNEETLQRLLDIQTITETVNAVCAAADSRDWEGCARYFAPEVSLRVGPPGSAAVQLSPAELVAQWGRVLAGCDMTLHNVGNHRVEVRGDAATCDSIVTGFHHAQETRGGENYCLTFGTFSHAFVRTGAGWRIRVLEFRQLYALGNQAFLSHQ
jgi:hypothetical protein